jgi:hypothetical protein
MSAITRMRIFANKAFRFVVVPAVSVASVLGLTQEAGAADWGIWQRVGGAAPVEVSFANVGNGMWAWKFRNMGSRTIGSFNYTYQSTFGPNTRPIADVEPHILHPGEEFGGWASFSCECQAPPFIQITSVNWAN